MERRRERARRRAGFTLAEVLVTLGIVAVLLALAVPSVAAAQKNLKMAELNATAKEIFLAAQNNLTGIAAGGGAVELSAKSGTADADETACVMSGPDAEVMEKLLPLGAVDPTVAGNHYMVVYYPATLTVKEVYYSERAFSEGGEALQSEYGGEDKAAARRKDEIGFYNGENTTSNPPRSLPKPTLTIENGEELVVKASVPKLEGELVGKVTLTVTVTSVSDPSKQCRIEARILNNVDLETEIVLDSLTGEHFYEKCPSIDPGDNIEITAEVTYTGSNDDTWLSNKDSKTTNSLFAERAGDTVKIACGRHLQNLDSSTSKIKPLNSFTAVQTADIDWSRSGKEKFAAIWNEDLTGYDGQNNEIKNLTVRPNEEMKVNGVGLFGKTSGMQKMTLSNIRIVNSNVMGEGLPSGSLIGIVNLAGASVDHCLVYWDGTGRKEDCYVSGGRANIGGLIGSAAGGSTSISYCGVGLPAVKGNRSDTLGGLVGYATAVTIANSYAAVDQISGTAEQIGGFIGHGEGGGVTITNCYAVGNISAARIENKETYYLSGFMTGSGTVSDSYCAMTYLTGAGEPRELEVNYGFMNQPGNHCAYLETDSAVTIRNESEESAQKLTYEALKDWKNSAPWTALDESFSHPYRTLEKDEAKSYPFPGLLTENGSPLPHYGSWPKEPEEKTAVAFVYYEVYTDGDIGFEGLTLDGAPLDGTGLDQWKLEDDPGTMVTRDGYAIVSAEALSKAPIIMLEYVYTKSWATEERTRIALARDDKLSVEGAVFYPLTYDHVQAPSSIKDSFFQELNYSVNTSRGQMDGSLWFNPCFAKTVSATDEGDSAATVAVRSARQLAALSEYSAGWGYRYAQELSIDELSYDRTYAVTLLHSAIGSQTTPFSGSYYGNGNQITGVQLGEKDYQDEWSKRWDSYGKLWKWILQYIFGVEKPKNASEWGLFGYNRGTLDGIVFLGDGENYTVSGKNCKVGGLCGENQGLIRGCAVAGFQVNTDTSSSAGGLVGINAGTIENSYTDNSSIEGHYVGGLAGEQVRGNISNSYALGKLEPTGGSWGTGNSAYAGGLVGKMTGGTVTNSYAACSAEDAESANYFPTSEKSENCYYLSDVWERDEVEEEALAYQELSEATIPGFSVERLDADHSNPYDDTLMESSYPFPVPEGQADHWGDWPVVARTEMDAFIGIAIRDVTSYYPPSYRLRGFGVKENDYSIQDMPQFDLEFESYGELSHQFYIYFRADYKDIDRWTYVIPGSGSPIPLSNGTPNQALCDVVPELKFYFIDIAYGHKVDFYYDNEFQFKIQLSQFGGKAVSGS